MSPPVARLAALTVVTAGLICAQAPPRIAQAVAPLPRVTAWVEAPAGTTFTGTLAAKPLTVASAAIFEKTSEGVAYLFLVDVSKSVPARQFADIRKAAASWSDNLRQQDRMAVMAFGSSTRIVCPFTGDRARIQESLAALKATDDKTLLHTAVAEAVRTLETPGGDLPARRIILIVTDGKDEGSPTSAAEVLEQARTAHVPVFALGYSRLHGNDRRESLDFLKQLGQTSGGLYREAPGGSLEPLHDELRQAVFGIWSVNFRCDACAGLEGRQPLVVRTAAAQEDSLSVLVTPAPPPATESGRPGSPSPKSETRPQSSNIPRMVAAGGVLATLLLAGVIFLILRSRKRKPESEPVPTDPSPLPPLTPPPPPGPGLATQSLVQNAGIPRGNPVRIQFVWLNGERKGNQQTVVLSERAAIGRDPGGAVALPEDAKVAPRHCELLLASGRVLLRGTMAHATLVNGVPLREQIRLESGDRILVGDTELRVTIG